MDRAQLRAQLTALLEPFTRNLPEGCVIPDTASLRDDLNVNSADLVDLVLEIEAHFGLEVPDSAMDAFDTPGRILDFLAQRVKDQAA